MEKTQDLILGKHWHEIFFGFLIAILMLNMGFLLNNTAFNISASSYGGNGWGML